MKKILIIGASILQLPAILKAKQKGFYVLVVDFNPNAVGIPYADEYFNISTTDIDGIIELAKKYNPNAIMTLATDMPMRAIAAATEAINLPGISYETAIKATDKGEMIKTFKENNIESPWYFITDREEELNKLTIKYPCIMKPVDSSGSRGVILVNKESEVEKAFRYSQQCSKNGNVIIEEYMTGKEVSVEILTIEGVPNVLAVTDKITTGQPYFVEMGHIQQSSLPISSVEKIKDLAIRAVKAIGIITGPAHVEIMMTEEGPKVIELGARMGGDCITSHLVELATGIDMVGETIELLCGNKVDITPKIDKGSAILYLKAEEGIIKEIVGIEEAIEIEGVKVIEITKNIGDKVSSIKSSVDRIGFIIAQGENSREALEICQKALEKINIKNI